MSRALNTGARNRPRVFHPCYKQKYLVPSLHSARHGHPSRAIYRKRVMADRQHYTRMSARATLTCALALALDWAVLARSNLCVGACSRLGSSRNDVHHRVETIATSGPQRARCQDADRHRSPHAETEWCCGAGG